MGALGEILELLHGAADRSRPARLTVVEWTHGPRSGVAFDRYMAERHGRLVGSVSTQLGARGSNAPDETMRTTTLAFESPTRYREDAAGAQAGRRYQVRDGERWVAWDADWGAVSDQTEQEGGPPSATYGLLLDPVALVGAYRLAPARDVEIALRPARCVRAVPRSGPEGATSVVFTLGPGADDVELAVDAERGTLLRAEARLGGEPFHRLEVTDITFGPLPAETFDPRLPPGVVASRWQRPERLPLHELQAAAPFPVLAPARLPDGWRLAESLFTAARGRPPIEAEVSLLYASANGAYSVGVSERAATGVRRDWLEWARDGDLETADAGEHVEPRHHVRVEREGTLVELSGPDPLLLRELARALAPAPTEAPRLSP